jgi:hypothetical protein
MSETTKQSSKGSDWTRLLTDPDLLSHLGTLLQAYREVSPEQREAALLKAMREIKDAAVKARAAEQTVLKESGLGQSGESTAAPASAPPPPPPAPVVLHPPEPVDAAPPFEADLFTPQSESDRRRYSY